MLISRAVLDAHPAKRAAIRAAGSIHRYLRLPSDGQAIVLGDCGAFSYWQDPTPPYETAEIVAYYDQIGVDWGVSIDHLIFPEVAAEQEDRWRVTLQNAEAFLAAHHQGGYRFVPIGVVQGWDPPSYRAAAQALMHMGYQHIAVGGLVRSSVNTILATLQAIQDVLRPHTQVHLFGVSRPEYAAQFARLGVTSFDSASWLRRAWMDRRHNYFLGPTAFTAIRIPDAVKLAQKQGRDLAPIQRIEHAALHAMRAYASHQIGLTEVYTTVVAYAQDTGRLTEQLRRDYYRTLAARPWEQCPCQICQTIGSEVIIFRGNNRNRRRGFHNIWQLYQQLHAPVTP